ncbi:hypothetical protein HU200_020475 [Digitaria exilis]|uniref:Uncharacterized protein n=1 Tax=Digitaria exilis TaxID=1010633 RepID=A0A835F202_9POAL|nr:hypothetical protein HU200_020475 [Digitaria exilis]
MDHIASTHHWPCTPVRVRSRRCPLSPPNILHLRTGFNFVVLTGDDYGDDNKYLFLLNVTRYPFCRAVSVIWICSRSEAVKEIRFELSCQFWSNGLLIGHNLKTEFRVAYSDLSDGLPSNGCHQLIVPITCDDWGDMEVNIEISIDQTPEQRRFDTEEDMEDDEPDDPWRRW